MRESNDRVAERESWTECHSESARFKATRFERRGEQSSVQTSDAGEDLASKGNSVDESLVEELQRDEVDNVLDAVRTSVVQQSTGLSCAELKRKSSLGATRSLEI
jgi:hypothetical protein